MSEQDLKETEITPPSGEKLQKVLARIGVGSRRDVEAWISQGRIKVNGVEATLGQRVDLHDAIAVDGKLIKREEAAEATRRVIMYNKPDGEICTRDDPEGARPCSTVCHGQKKAAGSTSAASTSTPLACCCLPPTVNWPTA